MPRVQVKGQVTISNEVRRDLHLGPGDAVIWVRNGAGRWELWKEDDLLADLEPVFHEAGRWSRDVKRGYAPRRK